MKTIPLILLICWISALIAYFFSVLGLIRAKDQKTFNTNFLNQIDQLLYLLTLGLPGAMIISMLLMGTGDVVSMTLLLFTGLMFLLPVWIGLRIRLRLLKINKHSSINFNDNWSQFELINDKESEIFLIRKQHMQCISISITLEHLGVNMEYYFLNRIVEYLFQLCSSTFQDMKNSSELL
jgi:hypothetical protein